MKEKIGEDKGFCLLRIKRVARIYGDFIFGKIRFWDALKSRLPRIAFLAFSQKTSNLAFLPKTESRFWRFPSLVFLGKKGGIL